MIVWVWKDLGTVAHAREQDEPVMALCGVEAPGRPLMRPPFPAVRCQACNDLKGSETQVFPNPHAKNLASDF